MVDSVDGKQLSIYSFIEAAQDIMSLFRRSGCAENELNTAYNKASLVNREDRLLLKRPRDLRIRIHRTT